MKTFFLTFFIAFLLSSCGTTIKFPVSGVTPAATITVTKKIDKNNNTSLSITANNLASAERLSPARNTYVVWITTNTNGVKNIGQLNQKNAQKSMLKTVTSFNPMQIFITAEYEGNITYPAGPEISRTAF